MSDSIIFLVTKVPLIFGFRTPAIKFNSLENIRASSQKLASINVWSVFCPPSIMIEVIWCSYNIAHCYINQTSTFIRNTIDHYWQCFHLKSDKKSGFKEPSNKKIDTPKFIGNNNSRCVGNKFGPCF